MEGKIITQKKVINPPENVSTSKYFITTVTNQNFVHGVIKSRLDSGNACYHSVQNLLSSRLLFKKLKIRIQKCNFACSLIWVCNFVSDFKGKTQTEGI
jgi:hypothetical protein